MPFTRETAKAAGLKSATVQRTTSKEDIWRKFGYRITGKYTKDIDRVMQTWLREGKYDKFMNAMINLLPYIKPKLQAHAIKQQTEVTIKLIHPDDQVMDKI